ncbi:hypothetical protein [Neorhizobium sp. T6_25]|jgi:hypothetical protein|uniref:hypothetical protein n=1 Tax=Neorhizobium sp. T6_25 TaxID=2093833 RepID=UPI000CF87F49|nr:hypothetical protein [Neorhizobium sp. T6_25]
MRKENPENTASEQAGAATSAPHLLHPASHFDHPRDVLAAEHIGRDEKRANLASWVSDISAIESMPSLRRYPGMETVVTYDEILDVLKALDGGCEPLGAQTQRVFVEPSRSDRRKRRNRRLRHRLGSCSYWNGRRRQLFET